MDALKFKSTLVLAEGDKRYPYDDANGLRISKGSVVYGHPSIGLGHNLDVPMSDRVVDAIYYDDLDRLMVAIRKSLPWFDGVDEVRQRAIVEIGWSGIGCLMSFAQSLELMAEGRWPEAAANIRRSLWARQVGPTRSDRVARMLETGQD